MADEYAARIGALQKLMGQRDLDLTVIAPSSDLRYLIGLAANPSERFKVLLIPREGPPAMVLPGFEMPTAEHLSVALTLYPWGETDDPLRHLATAVSRYGRATRIALGDQMWTVFALRIQATLGVREYLSAGDLMAILRMRKSAAEVSALRDAARKADHAFQHLTTLPFAGRTEQEILGLLHDALRQQGFERLGGGIVGAGPNGASPHHKTSTRRIMRGEAVVLDYGGQHQAYSADITRTVHVGPPETEFRTVYQIVQQAQQLAFEEVRPGVPCQEIDHAARAPIARAGYGQYFTHRTGHGIGLDGHEPPYIIEGNTLPLEPGMTFSIEPGVYLPGKFGVRIEDIVVVTETGAERLNTSTRELVTVQ